MPDEATLYLMPTTVPCPSCGARMAFGDVAIAHAENQPIVCACGYALTLADIGRYCARIDNVASVPARSES